MGALLALWAPSCRARGGFFQVEQNAIHVREPASLVGDLEAAIGDVSSAALV